MITPTWPKEQQRKEERSSRNDCTLQSRLVADCGSSLDRRPSTEPINNPIFICKLVSFILRCALKGYSIIRKVPGSIQISFRSNENSHTSFPFSQLETDAIRYATAPGIAFAAAGRRFIIDNKVFGNNRISLFNLHKQYANWFRAFMERLSRESRRHTAKAEEKQQRERSLKSFYLNSTLKGFLCCLFVL